MISCDLSNHPVLMSIRKSWFTCTSVLNAAWTLNIDQHSRDSDSKRILWWSLSASIKVCVRFIIFVPLQWQSLTTRGFCNVFYLIYQIEKYIYTFIPNISESIFYIKVTRFALLGYKKWSRYQIIQCHQCHKLYNWLDPACELFFSETQISHHW